MRGPAADGVASTGRRRTVGVYAFALACPHENAAVKWVAKEQRFQCTRHDSRYTPEGQYTSGRATRNLDRFPIRRATSVRKAAVVATGEFSLNRAAKGDSDTIRYSKSLNITGHLASSALP